ncbi:hypothetical protein [Streptosporangium roseum]|uniref:Lipoprotein n=1 Tax=Streptosporangium roseum (strain ATCC 12428 / DSM 43021 / JCM 3005 / KCTC 9067 / NCIMB 10171 / NRRL 2505 / NI 9100) TaxID=479432 RepID=D2BCZ5_STRRD|nr:hypothetical protein [Streptosporangium roseum]ACZ84236.1 hypothetical protein Sros_1238 [Streptosporangium roseum DSM 43021]
MKRYIAGLACAATAVLSAPALASTAHAQAADPISALKSQFSSGRGVNFVDTTKTQGPQGNMVLAKRTGALQFGPSGISASDQTAQLRFKASDFEDLTEGEEDEDFSKFFRGLAKPERVVRIKNTTYVSGGVMGEFMPADKTWVRFPDGLLGFTGAMSQFVNVAEPATLKALLAHATKHGGTYSGKITFGELNKVSPWFRASLGAPTAKTAKIVVSWKLFLGSDRLAKRLVTTYSTAGSAESTVTVDTRYTGWGSKVTVKAPPADQVADLKDLEEGAETATSIPLLGN